MRKVTVGIPCFNESKNILKCLDSITSQSDIFQSIEVLIVDDGSTDDTVKIIENYKKQYNINGNMRILTQKILAAHQPLEIELSMKPKGNISSLLMETIILLKIPFQICIH